jgi:DNA polymerase-1
MAHLSEDRGLVTAFETGQDVHRATAAEIFGVSLAEVTDDQRRYAKVINFGLIYGMSAFGLAQNLDIPRDAAKVYIDRYFDRYPGVARYMEQTKALAKAQGYVETVFGRRLWLDEIRSPNGPRRAAAERAAINAPMQLTAGGFQSRLLLQVHDELILEVPDHELATVEQLVPRVMEQVAQMRVPLLVSVGVGMNWDDAH